MNGRRNIFTEHFSSSLLAVEVKQFYQIQCFHCVQDQKYFLKLHIGGLSMDFIACVMALQNHKCTVWLF